MNENLINLQNQVISNHKQIKKLLRLIYLLENNIKVYRGKNGGIYYKTLKSKIYL